MSAPSQKSPLLLARADDAGPSSAHALSAAVDAGRLVRVRRGVYLETAAWLRSPPWERHVIAAAAQAAAHPETIFCRETALALHGISLLETGQFVDRRVTSNADTGRRAPRSVTGAAPRSRLEQLDRAAGWGGRATRDGRNGERSLRNIPLRGFQYPQLYRSAVRRGLDLPPAQPYLDGLVELAPPELDHVEVRGIPCRTEPLELAAVDTAHRMRFPSAVAVFDACRGGQHQAESGIQEDALQHWGEVLPSGRSRARTRRAWDFTDGRAENPGESWSRVLIHELGFQAPDLQTELFLPEGGRAYVDFFWEDAKIVGEFDGDQKYLRASQFGMSAEEAVLKEKKREDDIRRMGYRVLRWDWAMLHSPQRLERLLRGAGVPRQRR